MTEQANFCQVCAWGAIRSFRRAYTDAAPQDIGASRTEAVA